MVERIAIVGGGIIGCLVARQLLAVGARAHIVLVERDLVGFGASQRSAGVHFPIGRTERLRGMTRVSQQYYDNLRREDPELPLFPLDFFAVSPVTAAPDLRTWFTVTCAYQALPPGRFGLAAWPPDSAVWAVSGCHYADVSALVQILVRQMRDRVCLLEGVGVEAILDRCDGVELRLSTGDVVQSEKVVLAPGPWVNAPAWRDLTAPLGVRIKKIVALHVDRPVGPEDAAVLFPQEDAFIIPLRDRGHWLYSYTCTEWDVHPDDILGGLSDRNLHEARAVLRHYGPELAASLRSGRIFCDAYSRTREPLVTAVGEFGNVIFAGAANGSGYRLAPAIAQEAIRLLNLNHSQGVSRCAS